MSDIQKLKALAENYRNLNGESWYAEESKALDSIPCFSVEAFIAAANPAAVLELIAENERLKADLSGEMDQARDFNIEHEELKHERDQLKVENEALRTRVSGDEKKLDALLSHCDDGECATCGQIICPHGSAMHFHHDGCPSCAEHDAIEREQQP